MSVNEFLTLCDKKGWHFTAKWVKRKLWELQREHLPATKTTQKDFEDWVETLK